MRIDVGTRTLLAKTCRCCGELKPPEKFGHVKVKRKLYVNSECYSCQSKKTLIATAAHQERVKRVAVRHQQPWTDQDIKKLSEMTERGLSGAVMALALNRTVYSVYTMKNRLNKETPR